ncbi:MAG TPA: group III truncated hemoglobin [Phnomibacter sp.]|nr:group III truncated hemoglobin [Phnomibacter sp.]
MLPDIKNRDDIVKLVNAFYEKVKADPQLGPYFTEKHQVDWVKHLPVMYDFWDNILFYSGSYGGNPMAIHQKLHKQHPMTRTDFERWLKLFTRTTDSLFEGNNAGLIKQRAKSIATVMQIKILHP